jgi:hypothetical protein
VSSLQVRGPSFSPSSTLKIRCAAAALEPRCTAETAPEPRFTARRRWSLGAWRRRRQLQLLSPAVTPHREQGGTRLRQRLTVPWP